MLSSIVQAQIKKIKSGFARPLGYPKTHIKKVGVIGAGLMGHGISLVSSLNGVEVILLDKTIELLNKKSTTKVKVIKLSNQGHCLTNLNFYQIIRKALGFSV